MRQALSCVVLGAALLLASGCSSDDGDSSADTATDSGAVDSSTLLPEVAQPDVPPSINDGCAKSVDDEYNKCNPYCQIGCSKGQHCAADNGIFVCVPVGSEALGNACTDSSNCALGLSCFSVGSDNQSKCRLPCLNEAACGDDRNCNFGVNFGLGGQVDFCSEPVLGCNIWEKGTLEDNEQEEQNGDARSSDAEDAGAAPDVSMDLGPDVGGDEGPLPDEGGEIAAEDVPGADAAEQDAAPVDAGGSEVSEPGEVGPTDVDEADAGEQDVAVADDVDMDAAVSDVVDMDAAVSDVVVADVPTPSDTGGPDPAGWQSSCGDGMACYHANQVVQCMPVGSMAPGAICDGLSNAANACAPGLQCFVACTEICNTNSSASDAPQCATACPDGGFIEVNEELGVGVCTAGGPPTACDLFAQTGCVVGEACYPVRGGHGCRPEGDVKPGETCRFTNDCTSGHICVNQTCQMVCDNREGAPLATSCDEICDSSNGLTPAEWGVGICTDAAPAVTCDFWAQDCPEVSQSCYFVTGGATCLDERGNAPVGGECQFVNDCAAGLMCVSDACVQPCSLDEFAPAPTPICTEVCSGGFSQIGDIGNQIGRCDE